MAPSEGEAEEGYTSEFLVALAEWEAITISRCLWRKEGGLSSGDKFLPVPSQ